MERSTKPLPRDHAGRTAAMRIESRELLERLVTGVWAPNIDLCETPDRVVVRVELPGVEASDVEVTMENGVLRVTGVRREPRVSKELVCYYCVERSYGRFTREIPVNCVVDSSRVRASLRMGVLTLTLPRISERRGAPIPISITKDHEI